MAKGGAVFARRHPIEKCRAAKNRAAPVGQLSLTRLAIPRSNHIKAIVTEFLHSFFFFRSPSGIIGGNLSIFFYFSNRYGYAAYFARAAIHFIGRMFQRMLLLSRLCHLSA